MIVHLGEDEDLVTDPATEPPALEPGQLRVRVQLLRGGGAVQHCQTVLLNTRTYVV